MIHLCQKKTGKKKKKKRDQGEIEMGTVTWVGGGGRRIKRTPEITKAFERQVQYRGRRRNYRVGGGNSRRGWGVEI